VSNSFFDAPKLEKDKSKKENYRPISLMNINAKLNPTTHQKDHAPGPSQLHPRDIGVIQHMQIYKCNTAH
jgi:hypothetical protein